MVILQSEMFPDPDLLTHHDGVDGHVFRFQLCTEPVVDNLAAAKYRISPYFPIWQTIFFPPSSLICGP